MTRRNQVIGLTFIVVALTFYPMARMLLRRAFGFPSTGIAIYENIESQYVPIRVVSSATAIIPALAWLATLLWVKTRKLLPTLCAGCTIFLLGLISYSRFLPHLFDMGWSGPIDYVFSVAVPASLMSTAIAAPFVFWLTRKMQPELTK